MATVTRGYTFGSTEQVTNTKLHSLADSATVTAIVSADFQLTTTNPIHVGAAAPSDSNQKAWYDSTNSVLMIKDSGGTFQPVARGHQYTNKDASSVTAGQVVILDTANDSAVKLTTSANSTDVFGVVLIGGAADAEVTIITEGFCPAVNVTGSTDNGDYLFTSTTSGKCDPSSSHGAGAFARAMTTSSTSVSAQLGGAPVTAAIGGARFAAVSASTHTHDVSTATGAQSYAHGLGQKPVEVRAHYGNNVINGSSGSSTCISLDGGSTFTQACNYVSDSASAQKPDVDITAFLRFSSNGGADDATFVVTSWDATNVTGTWTKTGSPTGEIRFAFVSTA
jgi:hypothetical protein